MSDLSSVRVTDGHLTSLLHRLSHAAAVNDVADLESSDEGGHDDTPRMSAVAEAPATAPERDAPNERNRTCLALAGCLVSGLTFGFLVSLPLADLTLRTDQIGLALEGAAQAARSPVRLRASSIHMPFSVRPSPRPDDQMAVMNIGSLLATDASTSHRPEASVLPGATSIALPDFLMPMSARTGPFPIEVSDTVSHGSGLILLSGFADGVTFSHGKHLGGSVWALKAADRERLQIAIPESVQHEFDVRADFLSANLDDIPHDVLRVHWERKPPATTPAISVSDSNVMAEASKRTVSISGIAFARPLQAERSAAVERKPGAKVVGREVRALTRRLETAAAARTTALIAAAVESSPSGWRVPLPTRNLRATPDVRRIARARTRVPTRLRKHQRRRLLPSPSKSRKVLRVKPKAQTKRRATARKRKAQTGYNGLSWNPFGTRQ